MGDSSEVESLNSSKYLYLRELAEPKDNSLRITVDEAIANRVERLPASAPGSNDALKDYHPIEHTRDCKGFELTWKHYIAYLVTEECVGSCGDYQDEMYTGKVFRVYSKSHFLEHLARDTGGHTQPIHHYKLICLNHLVDVASYSPPAIRALASGSEQDRTD